MKADKLKCPPLLTVIFRNDEPLVHCNDSPSYRSVQVRLTDEQRVALGRHWYGTSNGTDDYESISKCFLEEFPDATRK